MAYVHKNLANLSLLTTYSHERQPVGQSVITRANQGFRDHLHVWQALGITEANRESRIAAFNELKAATPAGSARRLAFQKAIEGTCHEFHALGQEMSQRYVSKAIYLEDEAHPRPPPPSDPVLTHEITTYPGSRLPHAWLNTRVPAQQFSTIDLAGHGLFVLFTGIGGDKWRSAAESVGRELNIEIKVYSIGWCQDYEDVYCDWARRREVQEDGCVLVRPDRFVCWRSMSMQEDCEGKLRVVMKSLLGF